MRIITGTISHVDEIHIEVAALMRGADASVFRPGRRVKLVVDDDQGEPPRIPRDSGIRWAADLALTFACIVAVVLLSVFLTAYRPL